MVPTLLTSNRRVCPTRGAEGEAPLAPPFILSRSFRTRPQGRDPGPRRAGAPAVGTSRPRRMGGGSPCRRGPGVRQDDPRSLESDTAARQMPRPRAIPPRGAARVGGRGLGLAAAHHPPRHYGARYLPHCGTDPAAAVDLSGGAGGARGDFLGGCAGRSGRCRCRYAWSLARSGQVEQGLGRTPSSTTDGPQSTQMRMIVN